MYYFVCICVFSVVCFFWTFLCSVFLQNGFPTRYAVAEWYEAGLCDREVAGSTPARGCCVPTLTQCAIPPGSVNE